MPADFNFINYQESLAEGRLTAMICGKCGAYTTPPQGVCRLCGGTDTRLAEIDNKGTLRTFTIIRVGPEGTKPPYIVALVETKNGPWVMGNLLNIDPERTGPEIIGKSVDISSRVAQGDIYAIENIQSLTFTLAEP